ncbi:MipA/OmpV family protein [Thalassotalea psychrophila]|uniref:MipA/OmpV family protein n=1 Tax=Thalassotalea psychrophila TaxID=3065647 RepID=A0ABY9TYX5_9GAMM|nr:MipA/OmpV family protein [Colwelliaceae bacterium SQ149]
MLLLPKIFSKNLNLMIISALLLLSMPLYAQEEDTEAETVQQEIDDTFFVLKFSAGDFHYDSPLSDKKDIELNFLPNWTFYYKDVFFIERTKIGANIYLDDKTFVDVVGKHNFDGVYYHGDDKAAQFSVSPFLPPFNYPSKNAHLSYLGGIEVKKYFGKERVEFGAYTDISNVHHGEQIELSWMHLLYNNEFKLALEIGAQYKSDQLLEYYYGSPLVGDNVNYYSQIDAAYTLTDGLLLVFNYKFERLSSKIISSQVTDKKDLTSMFLGISWSINL